ncbi:hypothetical protein C0995_004267 [Termitomyces sp. Mi166|nr:hypothetical protein C0995_004267 [Termitomyces sp. Mi166\
MHAGPLYHDPAFSSDPHAHPFFATPWSLKPHDRPRPMFSDDHSSTTHESSSSSNHTSSTPPTSADSHSAPWTPTAEKSSHLRWPPEVQKKKKTLAMFWRRSPPETVLASVDLTRNVSPDPSPRTMSPRTPVHSITAPGANVSSNRPKLLRRPPTSATDFKPPPLASRRIAGGLAMRGSELDRIDELDESNPVGLSLHHGGPYEAVHKTTCPTENNVPHNIGSQYQLPPAKPKEDTMRDRKQERIQVTLSSQIRRPHRRNLSDVTSVPIVPAGVSLNLSPGQILPHNFYHQLHPTMAPTTAPSNAPGWPPQQHHSGYQPLPRTHDRPRPQPQPRTRPRFPPYQNLPINHDNQQACLDDSLLSSRHQNSPPEYSALPTDYYEMKGGPNNFAFFAPYTSNYEREKELNYDLRDRKQSSQLVKEQLYPGSPIHIVPDLRAPTPGPRHYYQSNNRLPPRMQALQMQIPRFDEKQRRPSRPPNGNHDYAAPPVGGTIAIQAGHLNQSNVPPMVDNVHQVPLFVDNNGFPASAPVPPSFEILQVVQDQTDDAQQLLHGLDNGSGRSIHSSSRSTNSGYPRGAPPPHHLPKRLVMPAPLQTSQPVAPRYQSQPKPPPRHLGHHTWQPQLRPSSPPAIPVALDSYTESQLRVEDIQMSQVRKLRKRSSVQAIPQPTLPSILPSQPLSFGPTPTYNDVPSLQSLSIRKPDKSQKKVLSKRRIELEY